MQIYPALIRDRAPAVNSSARGKENKSPGTALAFTRVGEVKILFSQELE